MYRPNIVREAPSEITTAAKTKLTAKKGEARPAFKATMTARETTVAVWLEGMSE